MRAFLSSSEIDGTVFEPLREPPYLPEREWLWVWCSGRTVVILHQTRCTMQFAKAASGFWIRMIKGYGGGVSACPRLAFQSVRTINEPWTNGARLRLQASNHHRRDSPNSGYWSLVEH